MSTNLVLWDSPRGDRLSFQVHTKNADWNPVAGLYAFCKHEAPNTWVPLYVGQASSFQERICSHERWDEAAQLGATHVLAATVPLQSDRDRHEEAIVKHFDPQLNVQLRPVLRNLGLGASPPQWPGSLNALQLGAGLRAK